MKRLALFLAWVAAIAALGWYVQRTLVVGADLRLFMPTPVTDAQRLLVDEIGEGPGSRLLLVALTGADADALAESSQALVAALREDPAFRFAANGSEGIEQVPDALLPYRYLLSPRLATRALDAAFLREELIQREQDLASPAAALLEDWLPRDPTLETLQLAQAWQPTAQPERQGDVWFDPKEARALLAVETRAPGFDPDAQQAAIDRIEALVAETRSTPGVQAIVSGPGAFSAWTKARTAGEAQSLGTIAGIAMLVLLLFAYRSVPVLVLSALPLASAGLAGLAAVSAMFGTVHGITLAFGFTLIGVAQDYPMHLFSHQHAGLAPRDNARALWPTLATGVASTCIAYLAFLASGVVGLAQLAAFTIAGLAVAGATTRWLLPPLMRQDLRDAGDSRVLDRLWRRLSALPRPAWAAWLLAVAAALALVFVPGPLWQNNLATLAPIAPELLARDISLRQALGAPDVRQMLVIEARDADAVLTRGEQLLPALDQLVTAGAIAGYDLAARYLPSIATQRERQARLPARAALESALAEALRDSAFRPDAFTAFVAEVGQARSLPALTPAALADTPLGLRVTSLLLPRGDHEVGLVTLTGVRDADAVARVARDAGAGVSLLDLKAASESLIAAWRERILWSLAIAAVLLAGVVTFSLRQWPRVRRVLAPMALTTLLLAGGLHAAGVPLSLFHLVALVLAAGLGLDYALFFEHAADEPAEQRRTLHALLVCATSTLLVFALLATSSLPVLRAIGITVSAGVVLNFFLALLLTRPAPAR